MAALDIVMRARDQASQPIRRVRGELEGAGMEADRTGGRFGNLNKLALAAGAGLLAAGAAAAAIGRAAFASALEIGMLADAASTTTDQIQRFQVIANATGGTVDALADGQRELGLRLGELAATGGGPALEALQVLGIEFQSIRNLSPEQQFTTIARALTQVEDTSQRAFLAEELLGGQFAENARVINLTTSEFDSLNSTADNARKITGENIEAMEDLSRWFNEAKRVVLTFAAEGIGTAIRFFENWRQVAGNVLQDIGDAFETYINSSIDGLNIVVDGINVLVRSLNRVPGVNIGLIDSIGHVNFEFGNLVRSGRSATDTIIENANANLIGANAANANARAQGALAGALGRQTGLRGAGLAFARGDIEGTRQQAVEVQTQTLEAVESVGGSISRASDRQTDEERERERAEEQREREKAQSLAQYWRTYDTIEANKARARADQLRELRSIRDAVRSQNERVAGSLAGVGSSGLDAIFRDAAGFGYSGRNIIAAQQALVLGNRLQGQGQTNINIVVEQDDTGSWVARQVAEGQLAGTID